MRCIVDVRERDIGNRYLQELAQRLPPLLDIEGEQLLLRTIADNGLVPFDEELRHLSPVGHTTRLDKAGFFGEAIEEGG